jgi:hypothetical protein
MIRLALTVTLFAAWLGYLGFQVVTRPRTAFGQPLVVSRPQVLASEIDVVADVPDLDGQVTVVEVLYPAEKSGLKAGDKIQVSNVGECAPPPRGADVPPPFLDWSGPGRYVLPLRGRAADGSYRVARVPPSPGFDAEALRFEQGRLYPDGPAMEQAFRSRPRDAREVDVVAAVRGADSQVTVKKVLAPSGAGLKAGETIEVRRLQDSQALPRGAGQLLKGGEIPPGDYILPLTPSLGENNTYRLLAPRPPRIYPDTPETRAQYHQIEKPARD